MSKQPLVSIIIPLYNSEAYIEETIQSALNQIWRHIEIIIVDDGSTDNSLRIAKKYESEQVKVFSQPNKGASAARNYGLREARGDYIQFLDADDLLSPNKLEAQLSLLKNDPDCLSICPTVYFFEDENCHDISVKHNDWLLTGSNNPIDFLIKLYGGELIGKGYGGMITIHSWLTPASIIRKAGYWNEELTVDDDGEYFCRVVLSSSGIKYAKGAVNYYRKFSSNNNLSSRKGCKDLNSMFQSWMLKKKHLEKYQHPHLSLIIRRNLTELYYYFYKYDSKLAYRCLDIVNKTGGITHKPFFGNRILNKVQSIFGIRLSLFIQKYMFYIRY